MLDPRLLVGILIDQIRIQILEIGHTMLFSHILDKDKEEAARRFRVIVGHVMMLQSNLETLGQRPQTMTLVLWIEVAGKFQRVNDWLSDFRQTMPLIIDIHKAHVKGSIMGNKDTVLAKFLKLFQHLLQWFGIADMLISNPSQIRRKGRQRMARIDKLIKLSDDIALVHLAGSYLNQAIVDRRKPRRFHVKDYIGRIAQLHVHFIVDDGYSVFYNIGLHTVNQLNTSFLGSLVAMGKALHIAMVGNGDSLVAPLSCRCNDFLDLRQGVHRRHIGMSVKLDPLLALRHQVLALIVSNCLHILHIHGQVAGEVVHLHISPHAQPGAFLNHVKLLGFFFVFHPFLQGEAGSVVCHLEIEQDSASSSDLLL